jgi:hypothetical protein
MNKADREPQAPEGLLQDPTITGLAKNNPVLLAKLLHLQEIMDFEGEYAVWRHQAETDLATVLGELKAGSQEQDSVLYWMNPSVQPPHEDSFNHLARATINALAVHSPFFEAVQEVIPQQWLNTTAPIEDVSTGDYL